MRVSSTELEYSGSDNIDNGKNGAQFAMFRLNRISGQLIYSSKSFETNEPTSKMTIEFRFDGFCHKAQSKF